MIERRSFLKLAGLVSAAAVAGVSGELAWTAINSVTVTANGKLYRSDGSPRIHVSDDGGRSWALHTYLGPGLDVERLTADGSQRVHATVAFKRRTFELVLGPDERLWWTA